jgi:hypothetical protein
VRVEYKYEYRYTTREKEKRKGQIPQKSKRKTSDFLVGKFSSRKPLPKPPTSIQPMEIYIRKRETIHPHTHQSPNQSKSQREKHKTPI